MKNQITFYLSLCFLLILSYSVKTQAQDDTVRSVIISEFNGGNGSGELGENSNPYVELCNMGDTAVNLSNFELGSHLPRQPQFEPRREALLKLPDYELEPGETFLIAKVNDVYPNQTFPGIWENVDLPVHTDDDIPGPQGGEDSISVYHKLLDYIGGKNLLYLEYHVGGDSAVVDALHHEWYPPTNSLLHFEKIDVAGVAGAYTNHLLVRKSNIEEGSLDWDGARGTSLENSEWIPIPFRQAQGTARYFTTLKYHGIGHINADSVSSDVVEIDWDNNKMTVPWGIYADSVMDHYELGKNIAWHYDFSPVMEDSVHNIVRTGDSLTLFAVGETRQEVDFYLEQAPAAEDMALVFPKNKKNWENGNWFTPFYVTENHPVIDTVGGIGFSTRVDTLKKYLEKAPGATWGFEWVDDNERVDLKRGDILKVTAEDGETTKQYFLDVDTVPSVSHNANLAAITWPDAPKHLRQNPNWKDDTIPGFHRNKLSYTIKVPYGTKRVPALIGHTEDLNASIATERATVINGPVEDRTAKFIVTAEDDSTIVEYSVLFKEEVPEHLVQPFHAEPVFTRFAYREFFKNNYMEVSNPGNQSLDLSNYLIAMGGAGETPADVIENVLNNPWKKRYYTYVPGYMYQSEEEWGSNPGILEKDLAVNPVIEPGGSFVTAKFKKIEKQIDNNQLLHADDVDVLFNKKYSQAECEALGLDVHVLTPLEGVKKNPWTIMKKRWMTGSVLLYKILNDSVKAGTKPVGDPGDFKLVEVFATYNGDSWSPAGDTLLDLDNKWNIERKPEYWKGDTLPGYQGSWGRTEEESEWDCTSLNDYKQMGYGMEMIADRIGSHTFNPISVYKSTITSFAYKVSDGYESPQSIEGVVTGTEVNELVVNINKKHEDQQLEVIGTDGTVRADDETVVNEDTLKVTSADEENVTKYALSVTDEGLDSDAELISDEYTVEYEGSEGSISGISFGTTIKEVLGNVTKPRSAVLNVVDAENNLVPKQKRNMDSIYVDVQASSYIYFEVVAEDGVTAITYQLQMDTGDDEAYLFSDVYDVDQDLNLVSLIPQGTNVQTLFRNLKANEGAGLKLVDKMGYEREMGSVSFDDEVVVTSADSSTKEVYYLKFKEEKSGSEAYVVSKTLGVDQSQGDIWGLQANIKINLFLGLITPAPEATVVVLDADSNLVESGEIALGYMLKVTSGDSLKQKVYTLYFSDEQPGTGAYVTSETFTVDNEAMTVSGIEPEISVEDFMNQITPAPKATVVILDADGNPVESGTITEGYTIQVTSGDGSKQVEYELSFIDTAVDPVLESSELSIYPNPATNNVFVEGIEDESRVIIRNIFGMVVKMVEGNEIQDGSISVDDLSTGVYFINARTGDSQSKSVKLIIH